MEPLRASPSVITRSTIRRTAAGSGASVRSPRPSARIASAIAACAHFAAEPCSPCALTVAGADVREKLVAASRPAGVSDQVRPMSTPAWSSLPPTPIPPWVST